MPARMKRPAGSVDPFAKQQHGAYAHFPGGGPRGTKCMDCLQITRDGQRSICLLWGQKMTPKVIAAKIPGISPNTDSCKYYEQRPAPRTTYKEGRR